MKKILFTLITTIIGVITGFTICNKILSKKIEEKEIKVDKFRKYYDLLNQWMILKHKGISIERFFNEEGYSTIAFYGMGELGNRLYEELKNTEIVVKYAIDKNAGYTNSDLEVLTLEEEREKVDAIVVTAIASFDEIYNTLKEEHVDCPIISLEEIIFNL